MSRATPGNAPIPVNATDNIYTVLALIGVITLAIGLLCLILRAKTLGVELFHM